MRWLLSEVLQVKHECPWYNHRRSNSGGKGPPLLFVALTLVKDQDTLIEQSVTLNEAHRIVKEAVYGKYGNGFGGDDLYFDLQCYTNGKLLSQLEAPPKQKITCYTYGYNIFHCQTPLIYREPNKL